MNWNVEFEKPKQKPDPEFEPIEWGSGDPSICIAENLHEAIQRITYLHEEIYTKKIDGEKGTIVDRLQLPDDDLTAAILLFFNNNSSMRFISNIKNRWNEFKNEFENEGEVKDAFTMFMRRTLSKENRKKKKFDFVGFMFDLSKFFMGI